MFHRWEGMGSKVQGGTSLRGGEWNRALRVGGNGRRGMNAVGLCVCVEK